MKLRIFTLHRSFQLSNARSPFYNLIQMNNSADQIGRILNENVKKNQTHLELSKRCVWIIFYLLRDSWRAFPMFSSKKWQKRFIKWIERRSYRIEFQLVVLDLIQCFAIYFSRSQLLKEETQ